MIDEIFSMIMKEAKARPGNDFEANLYTVLKQIGKRLLAARDHILETNRRDKNHEK